MKDESRAHRIVRITFLQAAGVDSACGDCADLADLSEAFRDLESTPTPENTPEASQALGDTFADLSWVLTGERRPPEQPTHMQTENGHALFYAGRINGMFGDPETAKSWLAMSTITQALHAGQTAAYLDIDHNGSEEIAERLMLLGADPTKIGNPAHFRVYEPEDRAGLVA